MLVRRPIELHRLELPVVLWKACVCGPTPTIGRVPSIVEVDGSRHCHSSEMSERTSTWAVRQFQRSSPVGSGRLAITPHVSWETNGRQEAGGVSVA